MQTIGLEWRGQFSKQIYSKWCINAVANVGHKEEPIAMPSHCS